MKRRVRGTTIRVRRTIGSAGATAALLAALAATAGCTGVGSGDGGDARQSTPVSADRLADDPLTAVRSAADITGRTGSARTVTQVVTSSPGKKAEFHGTGVYDYAKRIGTVSVLLPPGAATKGRMTEVVLPGIVYLQNSGAKVPAGKWVKLEVKQLPDGNLVSSGTTDPATAAGALRGAQAAKLVGTETVDGAALKHYRGTLDLAKAADATGGPGADGLRMAAGTFTVKQVPYDVWLDEQGRLHKVVEVFTFASVPGSTDKKDQVVVVSTTSLSDFGSPVEAAEPPASDVVRLKAGNGGR
ncbi:LolA-like protein [Peterkaempfera bronchialis]|uniref:Lipoprotein n=1 Tax=Peterkaempfera bronchialis TaxID=2126346 RepID=A0A345SX65_9ACTN|nr:hypothetical protein [Peterkaempfera bronchialis]AXI78320.1 hypothetical protein C7M71_013585 [Peterkaempfera bronchialis]